jgi:hypothetical protein
MLKIGTIVPRSEISPRMSSELRGIGVTSKGLMISFTERIHTQYSSVSRQNPKNSSARGLEGREDDPETRDSWTWVAGIGATGVWHVGAETTVAG